ncbi:MAG: ferredoxin [Nocardiaceae bacterium]|nr:ferredoxin [Nocardiaceae bacterium]
MTERPARIALHVDWTRCDGRGLCSELLPALIERDVWGYPLARDRTREPVVPTPMLKDARTAVSMCPRLALGLVEVDER